VRADQQPRGAAAHPADSAPTFDATELNHVALNVTDVQRSQKWYCYSIANYDPADAIARLKAAGLTFRREGGRVYFADPDGIECQVASA
jgi:catechol 2,3-dioxygenase-like lactoylglutathione lyase family enzyme